jgi:hypothetical protein
LFQQLFNPDQRLRGDPVEMRLYHFTALKYLESIRAKGLMPGEVALSASDRRENFAVWLTTDPEPDGHGLDRCGQPLTEREKIRKGVDLNEPAFWDNKREVRITLRIPSNDLRLRQWPTWARQNHVDQQWYQALATSGGSKHRTWWLYLGVIPPESSTR